MGIPADLITIIFPSLDPDNKIIDLIGDLRKNCSYPILVVNDGSCPDKQVIFEKLAEIENCTVIVHPENLGKGRALKNAFNHILTHVPQSVGVITADGDGQHRVADIIRCAEVLQENPDKLILGVRDFKQNFVPWKSRWGNRLTAGIFRWFLGMKIDDTQTGLRGIPAGFMKIMLDKHGERFEYETVMLVESNSSANGKKYPIHQVSIETVYEDNNRKSNFRPVVDSLKIYRIILKALFDKLFLFGCSGFLTALLEQGSFALFFYWIVPALKLPPLIVSVVLSRSVALVFNYLVNRNIVFGQKGKYMDGKSFAGFLSLCLFTMSVSYGLVKLSTLLFSDINVLAAKIIADAFLFFLSYRLQRRFIFSP